jgi:RHS repeat-associated protein
MSQVPRRHRANRAAVRSRINRTASAIVATGLRALIQCVLAWFFVSQALAVPPVSYSGGFAGVFQGGVFPVLTCENLTTVGAALSCGCGGWNSGAVVCPGLYRYDGSLLKMVPDPNGRPICGVTCADGYGLWALAGATCPPGYAATIAPGADSADPANLFCERTVNPPPPRTENLGVPQDFCAVSNPVNPATGNKLQIETDYESDGRFPLRLVRVYNSDEATPRTDLGPRWRHTYDRRIVSVTGATVVGAPTQVFARRGDGKGFRFTVTATPRTYTSASRPGETLLRLADASGATTGWQLTTLEDQTEEYNAEGHLTAIRERSGLSQTLIYNASKLLHTVADPFGRSLTFAYDAAGRLQTVTGPAGTQLQYQYGPEGQLTSVTYPGGEIRQYHYEDSRFPHALTGITDENGNRYASWAYDAEQRVAESSHAGGVQRYQFTYSADGSSSVVDPTGTARTNRFQVIGNVVKMTAVEGAVNSPCGNLPFKSYSGPFVAESKDWNSNRTCYQHDTARNLETVRGEGLVGECPGNLLTWTPAGGTAERRITTEWHPTWRLPTKLCEPKRITTLSYDAKANLASRSTQATSDAQGTLGCSAAPVGTARTSAYSYTYGSTNPAVATQIVVDGPRTDAADTATFVYEEATGNLLSVTNALGHATSFGDYDAHGKPGRIIDPNGLATTLSYDARQRLTSRNVDGELTSYEYDAAGQLVKVTLPHGSFLRYTYDAAQRLTEIADSLGNRISYTLDAMGNRTREDAFDPASQLARTQARVYSNLNRLVQEIGGTNPATQITSYGYDNQGNVTSIADPLAQATANAYDARNRLRQVTDPAKGVTAYGYDGLDQLTSVTDPRNNATTYALDGLGNLASQTSPDAGTTADTHDAAGNLLSSTDAKGQTTSYTYDALNRVTRIVYDQATGAQLKQVDFAYDQGANGIGRLSSITEISAAGAVLQTTTYGYDPHGRILSETRAIGGQTYVTGYAYDAAGRMTGMTYPSGRTTSYGLDGLGRVNRIETSAAGETRVVVQDVLYHPFGAPRAFTFGNLQPYARGFDLDGRIATYTLADQTKALSFDAAGRITRIEQQGTPTHFANFGYDALDRLTSTALPTSSFGFGYDPVGNRVSKSTGGSIDTYAYPPTSNRLSSITGSSGTRTYVHDANGSITGDGLNTFGYDARGRLVSAVSAAGTTGYQINALGQRVRKTSPLGDTVFQYDTQGRLLAESSASGAPIREYLWLADQPVAVASYLSTPGGQCAAQPTLDTSDTFVAFARRERMEVHSGRPGERGWEWGLGTNTRDFDASARADLDWISGKPYGFVLTYDGAGNARVTVRDGATELFTLTWTGGMDVGNALKFMVKSPAGIGAGNRISILISNIDGRPVSDEFATTGDNAPSQVVRVYAGASLQNGYSLEGTVTFTFTKSYPPRGNKLDFTVTAGNVTCQGPAQAGPPMLYYVHADHLNTPRAITDESQRVVWRWENTEPFGKSPPEEDPDGDGSAFEMPLRFPGTYADRETSTLYNYFRDYDPQTGRYLQPDPLGVRTTASPTPTPALNHIYGYAKQDPLREADPTGLHPIIQGLRLIGAFAGGYLASSTIGDFGLMIINEQTARSYDEPIRLMTKLCVETRDPGYCSAATRLEREKFVCTAGTAARAGRVLYGDSQSPGLEEALDPRPLGWPSGPPRR